MHIQKMIKQIIMLKDNNRENSCVIAFIIVELYFRPLKYRVMEYIYWIITGDLEISLGLAQIKVKNNDCIDNSSTYLRLKSIRNLESFIYNYDSVETYLKNDYIYYKDDLEICKKYNGKNCGSTYITYYTYAKMRIEEIQKDMIKNHSNFL